jgi:hypothetical protein
MERLESGWVFRRSEWRFTEKLTDSFESVGTASNRHLSFLYLIILLFNQSFPVFHFDFSSKVVVPQPEKHHFQTRIK